MRKQIVSFAVAALLGWVSTQQVFEQTAPVAQAAQAAAVQTPAHPLKDAAKKIKYGKLSAAKKAPVLKKEFSEDKVVL